MNISTKEIAVQISKVMKGTDVWKKLINNYKIALIDETLLDIVTALKKYEGKVVDRKAQDEIRAEVKEVTGHRISFSGLFAKGKVNMIYVASDIEDITVGFYPSLLIVGDFVDDEGKLISIDESMLHHDYPKEKFVEEI